MSRVGVPMMVFEETPVTPPEGYRLAPIERGGAVRLCVVLNGNEPVALREGLDARVYLACIADAAGRVQRWLELWVQEVDGVARAPSAYRDKLDNAALDQRWSARADALAEFVPGGLVRTGFETHHPPALFLDPATLAPVDGPERRLCTDEAALSQGGANAYASTLARYLIKEGSLTPANAAAGSEGPDALARSLGVAGAIPINPGAGLLLAAPFLPLAYDAYADALSGLSADHGDETLLRELAEANLGAGDAINAGLLTWGEPGRLGRVVETLHLKLRLLAEAVWQVREATQRSQEPLLNVSSAGFRVRVGGRGTGLPYLWTARVALVQPGEGLALCIPGATGGVEARYFLAADAAGPGIYRPAAMGHGASGRGLLRLRRVTTDASGTLLEATLTCRERLSASPRDLVWLRFAVAGARADVYGTVEQETALASGELRIRTVAQRMPGDLPARLKQAEGVPIQDAMFELVPMFSTPVDLYGLAVLGVRTLLVDGRNTLPIAFDELLSLAYQASQDADGTLEGRIAGLLQSDPRWRDTLGPHRLHADVKDPEEGLSAIPPGLWAEVLAALVRMLPAIGAESWCGDLGDAPAGSVHRVFDGPSEDLRRLLVRSRGLLLGDLKWSRELHAIASELMAKL
ncbi:MAG: hypothetical protein FJ255_05700 [Phycisphaerae bacterium]|nr:hypothetical protein [Phycisphaerae bacterium]